MQTPEPESSATGARVFLVEDHPLVLEGLAQLIGGEADLAVCGRARSAREALELVRDHKPDLVVVDISLGDGEADGLELIKDLHSRDARLPILALSMHDEVLYAERALRAGARGYIMKSEAMDEVRAAIRRVLVGEIYLSDRMVSRMIHKLVNLRLPSAPSLIDGLSEREFQVFRLIAEGVGPSQIAQRLDVSVKTVETHREHIKEKLGLKNGTELSRFAMQWASERR